MLVFLLIVLGIFGAFIFIAKNGKFVLTLIVVLGVWLLFLYIIGSMNTNRPPSVRRPAPAASSNPSR